MHSDCNGKKLKIGDKVRRLAQFAKVNDISCWPHGEEVCTITDVDKYDIVFGDSRVGWDSTKFQKVEEEMTLGCVRVTPAQKEKTEITNGLIYGKMGVRLPLNLDERQNVLLVNHFTNTTIGIYNSKQLREMAVALTTLANAMDKAFGDK